MVESEIAVILVCRQYIWLCLLTHPLFPLQPLFEPYLATQLEHTKFEFDSDSPVPQCQPDKGTALLCSFASLSRQLPDNQPGNSLVHREMQLLWSLAAALWAQLEGEDEGKCHYASVWVWGCVCGYVWV